MSSVKYHRIEWKSRLTFVVAVSCGYDTCLAVKICYGLNHFTFSIYLVGIPFGFQMIMGTFVTHTVSRCLTFPAIGVTWSMRPITGLVA